MSDDPVPAAVYKEEVKGLRLVIQTIADELGCDEPRCKWIMLEIGELKETVKRLKRVNKEWEALWKPIDELVRPLTPLGESVGDKAVDWIKQGMFYDPFKERYKAYSEWMGRQKTNLTAQITLQGVAKIAHAGGLYGYGDIGYALTRIREITLPYWDKVTHID